MNNPEEFSVDVEELTAWFHAHRVEKNLSWAVLGRASDIPKGTLSSFMTGTYNGNSQNVAKRIYKYRQLIESQEQNSHGLPVAPDFIPTPTAMRFQALLVTAQRGRMTLGATGPGTGKTMTVKHYAATVPQVWIATFSPTSAKTLASMIAEVLRAVGGDNKTAWLRHMSAQVISAVSGRQGILVCDEANHLDLEMMEQLRAWHDDTGVGICLLGNEELLLRIRGGAKSHAYGRLNSRIAMSHLQDLPQQEDIEMFLDAWGLKQAAMRAMLIKIGMTPGAGGLREIKQIIENASVFAQEDERDLTLADLRDAHSTRATRYLRVSA